jgi:hypothetical protein
MGVRLRGALAMPLHGSARPTTALAGRRTPMRMPYHSTAADLVISCWS